jgi:hypothetical protein
MVYGLKYWDIKYFRCFVYISIVCVICDIRWLKLVLRYSREHDNSAVYIISITLFTYIDTTMPPSMELCPYWNKSTTAHSYYHMNSYISRHTDSTTNSFQNKTPVNITAYISCPVTQPTCHFPQHRLINTINNRIHPVPSYSSQLTTGM